MKKKINTYVCQLVCILFVLLINSCKDDESVTAVVDKQKATTIIAPNELQIFRFYRTQSSQFTLMLSNSESFELKIVKKPDWFYCRVDTLAGKKAYRFNCYGNSETDSTLNLEGELEIEVADIGTKKIKIHYLNAMEPILQVDTLLNLDERWVSYIKMENIGVSIIGWKLISPDPNITFSRDSGYIMKQPWSMTNVLSIAINLNWGKYSPGKYSRYVKLISNNDTIKIKLAFEVGEIKKAEVPKVATISNDAKEVSYYIVNRGNMPLNWSVDQSSLPVYITTTPERGKIAAGDSAKITVKADRELLPKTNSEFDLGINIDSYQYDTYKTKIVILNYEDPKIKLNYNIVAAVQNKNTDEILLVSKSPNKLILMDFSGNIKKTKDLNYTPEAVSNELDDKIVITNGNRARIYNINDLTQTKEFTTKYNFVAVVITKKYIIGSSINEDDDGVVMRIELNNMVETDFVTGIYEYNRIIYNVTNDNYYCYSRAYGIYGFNAGKWIGLENYHENIAGLGGDCWIVSNGFKIISQYGSVFTSSEYGGLDGVYAGDIGISSITSIAENAKNELLAVSSDYLNYGMDRKKVYLIDNNYYLPKGEIVLSKYLFSNTDAQGYKEYWPIVRYSFINSDATKLMVFMTPHYSGIYTEIPKDNWTYYIANIK